MDLRDLITKDITVDIMKKKKKVVRIKELIRRMPERETGYNKKMGMEYWKFRWSDGTVGEGSLYQSQMKGLKGRPRKRG